MLPNLHQIEYCVTSLLPTDTQFISERALYAMEMSFHPLFNMATGQCRLDYRRPENR